MAEQGADRLGGLQAARAIAACLVFAQHLNWAADRVWDQKEIFVRFHPGSAGIAIFFVLSGYLMTARKPQRPLDFAVGRLRRIFPGLWIALALSAVVEFLLFGTWPGIDPALFVLYPAGPALNTLVPYWTLLFELLFYGLVFVAIAVLPRYSRLLVTLGLLVSYILSPKTAGLDTLFPTWDKMLLTPFSLLFLVGVLIGYLPRPRGKLVALSFAAMALAAYWLPGTASLFGRQIPYAAVLSWDLPVSMWAIAAGCAIYAALAWEADGILGRVLQKIGDASYGIYLTHVACLFVAFRLVSYAPGFANWPEPAKYLTGAALGFLFAYPLGWAEWQLQLGLKAVSRVGLRPFARPDPSRP